MTSDGKPDITVIRRAKSVKRCCNGLRYGSSLSLVSSLGGLRWRGCSWLASRCAAILSRLESIGLSCTCNLPLLLLRLLLLRGSLFRSTRCDVEVHIDLLWDRLDLGSQLLLDTV